MTSLDFLNGSLNPANAFSVIKNNMEFKKKHPDYFAVDGLITFCGPQRKWKDSISLELYKSAFRKISKVCFGLKCKDK